MIKNLFKACLEKCNILKSTFYLDTLNKVKNFVLKGDFVLDIGCGAMPYSSKLGCNIVALDRDKGLVNSIKPREGSHFLIAESENLPLKDSTFNKVIMTEVLEHLGDRERALGEVIRVIVKDGELFLSTPNARYASLERSRKFRHLVHYTEDELRALLKRYFNSVSVEKRFRWHGLLNLQYIFWERWLEDKKAVHFYLLKLVSAAVYNIIYPIERIFLKGRYNLLARCGLPRK